MKSRLTITIYLTKVILLSAVPALAADPLGWYRMGDDDASPVDATSIPEDPGGISNHPGLTWGTLRGRPTDANDGGRPLYSAEVPGAQIYDPISDMTYDNHWSMKTTNTEDSCGSKSNTPFDNQFSVEMFLYFDVEDMGPVRGVEFVNHRTTSGGGFDLQLGSGADADKVRARIHTVRNADGPNSEDLILYGTTELQPRTWYHLGLVYSANEDTSHNAELYVDHALENSGVMSAGQLFGTANFQVFVGHVSGGLGSSGLRTTTIDEFRYFNEAIDPMSFLQVPSVGIPGDYNDDGFVDAADYVMWRKNLDGPEDSLENRDPNNTGPINDDDYTFWVANFGTPESGASLSTSALIPEPAAIALIGIAAISISVMGRRRRR